MAKSVPEAKAEPAAAELPKIYSKKELEAFIVEIAAKVVDKEPNYLHSMLAMNHILRQPNLHELLDADLKEQLKDIWLKLKTTGLQLQDPPMLFGIEEGSIEYGEAAEASE